jgi:hypothetical protein
MATATQQRFDITSDWERIDDSRNSLEVAQTGELGVVALRNSADPGTMITATIAQLANMVAAFEDGKLRRLVPTNGYGHHARTQ